MDHGCKLGAPNSEGYTELHVLFGHIKHDIAEDVKIARQLIALGADVNAVSPRGGLVFNEVVMIGATEDVLQPLYDLWFEQPVLLDFQTPSKRGGSPMVYAQAVPFRPVILERMERYIAEHA